MRLKTIIILFVILLPPLVAQETEELPSGFNDITLGLTMDQAGQALLEEPYFLFRGEPDVSLLASPNESLIDCRGADYIERGLFQFHDDSLFIISIILNTGRMDYHSMFTALVMKYGEFTYLNPEMAVWENETVRLSLEKPLTVKYIHRETFEILRSEASRGINLENMTRQDFIEQF